MLPLCELALASGGPLGIDHQVNVDDSGIWQRKYQRDLINLMIAGEIAGAIWEGGETRPGKTFWQSIDATVIAGASAEVMKVTFSRERPSETDNPNKFFQGDGHRSFRSGEVAAVSAIVTPFVAEYRQDNVSIYALELLPVYDMVARVKVRGHWQSDVLAGVCRGHGIWRIRPFTIAAVSPECSAARFYGRSSKAILIAL